MPDIAATDAEMLVATRNAALARGNRLLEAWLDEYQYESWDKLERFTVLTDGGRAYIVEMERVTLWQEREGGDLRPYMSFCIGCEGYNVYDQMLAKKLLLEADEEAFLRTANVDCVYGTDFLSPEGTVIMEAAAARFQEEHGANPDARPGPRWESDGAATVEWDFSSDFEERLARFTLHAQAS